MNTSSIYPNNSVSTVECPLNTLILGLSKHKQVHVYSRYNFKKGAPSYAENILMQFVKYILNSNDLHDGCIHYL